MEAREELRKLRLKLTDKRNKDDKEDMMMFQTTDTISYLKKSVIIRKYMILWLGKIMIWLSVIIRFLVGKKWVKDPYYFMDILTTVRKILTTKPALQRWWIMITKRNIWILWKLKVAPCDLFLYKFFPKNPNFDWRSANQIV